ncbi:MAG: CBS domain-containing protein [Caldilineaceae bacterium]|nr:CBS domain-containing protein [Caldilineaceae bacterium]
MIVRDIMSSPVITVTPETSIQAVAQLMRDNHISGVPVVKDGGKLIGIVTEVDLIAQHAPAQEPGYISLLWATIPLRLDDYTRYKNQVRHILAVNAEQLMTEDPTTVSPEDTLEHVAGLMIKPGHSSLPVVENGKLLGIITRTDLVRIIEQLEVQG